MKGVLPPRPKAKPPYRFVVEALAPLQPEVRRIFSGYAVYVGNLLVFILREHGDAPQDNGVWLVLSEATEAGNPALRRELPSLRKIEMLGSKIRHWLVIPSDGVDFEAEALRACELVLRRDARVGRVPKSRRS
jgi:hypothetical protein